MSAFENFYGSKPSYYYEFAALVSKRISHSGWNVFVSNSVFRECTSNSYGGAIYLYSPNANLCSYIEDTSFIRCTTTSSNGGALYFYYDSYGLKSYISRVCAVECCAKYGSGQCFYIYVYNDINHNNYINNSCITNTRNIGTNSWYTQFIQNGRLLLNEENISNNACSYYSALYCQSSISSYVAYCSFVNNTAEHYGCLVFRDHQEIHLCNILGNDQMANGTSSSTICSNYNLFILDSCIIGNNIGKRVFYQENSNYKIELYKCTIDPNIFQEFRYSGNLTIDRTNDKDFIIGIKHLNTNLCEASYDSYGTLTVDYAKDASNKGLSVTRIQNARGSVFHALRIAQFMIINSFLGASYSDE
jgi:hypothetical protein